MKKIILLSILIIPLLVIVGCVLILQQPEQTLEENGVGPQEEGIQPKEDTAPEITEEDLDMSKWKTYTNEEYGFSFRYPEGLSVTDCSSRNDYDSAIRLKFGLVKSGCLYQDPNTRIDVFKSNENYNDYTKAVEQYSIDFKVEEININGNDVIQTKRIFEIRGGEGEELKGKPKILQERTYIPVRENDYLIFEYQELFEMGPEATDIGFEIQEDLSGEYMEIVKSFKKS